MSDIKFATPDSLGIYVMSYFLGSTLGLDLFGLTQTFMAKENSHD